MYWSALICAILMTFLKWFLWDVAWCFCVGDASGEVEAQAAADACKRMGRKRQHDSTTHSTTHWFARRTWPRGDWPSLIEHFKKELLALETYCECAESAKCAKCIQVGPNAWNWNQWTNAFQWSHPLVIQHGNHKSIIDDSDRKNDDFLLL